MLIANFHEAEAALGRFLPAISKRAADTTEHMQAFLEYVDRPQDHAPAVHIAGTSGKSSTAYYVAALLGATGRKVGLLVSPHVMQLNERVQINGQPLPEDLFCKELSLFLAIVQESGAALTYAEVLYAFAFWHFRRRNVDHMVIEVGRGGLLDATNVMSRPDKLCIITDISLDHTKALGNTLTEIAQHKAGIIRLHNTVFCYRQDPAVMREIVAVARQRFADLHMLGQVQVPAGTAFLPAFQRRNYALAVQAIQFWLEHAGEPALTPSQIQMAAKVYIPGRMEIMQHAGKTIIVDGAHNPQKLQALVRSLQQRFSGQSVAAMVAFGTSDGGRNVQDLLGALQPLVGHVIATTLPAIVTGGHHFRSAAEIAAACKVAGIPCQEVADTVAAYNALLRRPERVVVITGSLYLPKGLADQGRSLLAAIPEEASLARRGV